MIARALRTLVRGKAIPGKAFYWNTDFDAKPKGRDIYIMPKKEEVKNTVVWMHGLGDSAMGFLDFFDRQDSPVPKHTKVVLLTAPEMPVTINNGMIMNSWFDKDIDNEGRFIAKEEDVIKSYNRIAKVIEEEVSAYKGDYKKIVVGGYSQGCAMALYTGLTFDKILGGVCGLSGFLFSFTKLDERKKQLPIFLYHGKMDDVVLYEPSIKEYKKLKEQGFNLEIHDEDHLGHSISEKEDLEIKKFFNKILN